MSRAVACARSSWSELVDAARRSSRFSVGDDIVVETHGSTGEMAAVIGPDHRARLYRKVPDDLERSLIGGLVDRKAEPPPMMVHADLLLQREGYRPVRWEHSHEPFSFIASGPSARGSTIAAGHVLMSLEECLGPRFAAIPAHGAGDETFVPPLVWQNPATGLPETTQVGREISAALQCIVELCSARVGATIDLEYQWPFPLGGIPSLDDVGDERWVVAPSAACVSTFVPTDDDQRIGPASGVVAYEPARMLTEAARREEADREVGLALRSLEALGLVGWQVSIAGTRASYRPVRASVVAYCATELLAAKHAEAIRRISALRHALGSPLHHMA